MHRNTDSSGLVRDCSCDRLTDPPGCIGTEFISFTVVKFLNCLDKSEVSFLDQIQKQHSASHITLRNADYQTKVGFCQTFLGFLIALLHTLRKLDLLVCCKKADFTDLLEIHTDRILNADTFRH